VTKGIAVYASEANVIRAHYTISSRSGEPVTDQRARAARAEWRNPPLTNACVAAAPSGEIRHLINAHVLAAAGGEPV
jgi:hypothetical protein